MQTLENHIFTFTLTNGSITLQEGAKEINLKNVGDGSVTYIGDKANGAQVSGLVTIGVAETKSFPITGHGYQAITFNAIGATNSVEIEAIY